MELRLTLSQQITNEIKDINNCSELLANATFTFYRTLTARQMAGSFLRRDQLARHGPVRHSARHIVPEATAGAQGASTELVVSYLTIQNKMNFALNTTVYLFWHE